MMHHQDAGTHAPAFPNIDDAENFANSVRATVGNEWSVSEPVPVLATKTITIREEVTTA